MNKIHSQNDLMSIAENETYRRTDLDEEGNPYPLLYMKMQNYCCKIVVYQHLQ